MNFKYLRIFFLSTVFPLISCSDGESGAQGLNTLSVLTDEPVGVNCENGGVRLEIGLDENSNNVLDPDEINTTDYFCNGLNGNNGLTSLEEIPAGSTNCKSGGYVINSGIDVNNNNTLDDEEITVSTTVCHGINGTNSLSRITKESAGTNCSNGGLKIEVGKDINENGILENNEVSSVTYGCNANDGYLGMVAVSDIEAGSRCTYGGIQVSSGLDTNYNTVLDDGEIRRIETICNVMDGSFNKEVRIVFFSFGGGAQFTDQTNGKFVEDATVVFDKSKWSRASSIIYSVSAYSSDSDNSCFIELFDLTNNTVIAGSELRTNVTESQGELLISDNIIEKLPDEKVELGVRYRTEKVGTGVYITGKAELIINQGN